MLPLAIVLALSPCAAQAQQDSALQAELARLIEKTNAIQTLHLVYDIESEDEGKPLNGTMEVAYRAPGTGRCHMSWDSLEVDYWVAEGMVYMGGSGSWKKA